MEPHLQSALSSLIFINSCHFILLPSVIVWIRMVPTGSYMWMLSHQGTKMFEKIRRIKRCVLVEEVWPHWRDPMPDPFSLPPKSLLLMALNLWATSPVPVCGHAPCYDSNGLTSASVSQPLIKCFLLYELPWSWCILTAIKPWLRHPASNLWDLLGRQTGYFPKAFSLTLLFSVQFLYLL